MPRFIKFDDAGPPAPIPIKLEHEVTGGVSLVVNVDGTLQTLAAIRKSGMLEICRLDAGCVKKLRAAGLEISAADKLIVKDA